MDYDETIKVEMWASTDKIGSHTSRTIDTGCTAEEWAEMNDFEKEQLLSDSLWSVVEWGWEEA